MKLSYPMEEAILNVIQKFPEERWGEAWEIIEKVKHKFDPSRGHSIEKFLFFQVRLRLIDFDRMRIGRKGGFKARISNSHSLDFRINSKQSLGDVTVSIKPENGDSIEHLLPSAITEEERLIIQNLLEGRTHKESAERMGLTEQTFSNRIQNLRFKYMVHLRREDARSTSPSSPAHDA